jgi:hypothetical protein
MACPKHAVAMVHNQPFAKRLMPKYSSYFPLLSHMLISSL